MTLQQGTCSPGVLDCQPAGARTRTKGAGKDNTLCERANVEPLAIDDVLVPNCVGGFGPAQWLVVLLGGLTYMASSATLLSMIFTMTDPLVSSNISGGGSGGGGGSNGTEPWRCSDPNDKACAFVLLRQQGHKVLGGARAAPLTVQYGSPDDSSPPPTSLCDLQRTQYVWNQPHNSIVTEYDVVCGRAGQATLAQTLFFLATVIGNAVFGPVSDRYGRRPTTAACAAATAVLTLLSAWPALVPYGPGVLVAAAAAAPPGSASGTASGTAEALPAGAAGAAAAGAMGGVPGQREGGGGIGQHQAGLWIHVVLWCASGTACAGQALAGYVLATEMVGPARRGAAGMLVQTLYVVGELLLVACSLALPAWRSLTVAVSLPSAAACALALLVPESPRWLLLRGRHREARAALLWIARLNGRRNTHNIRCTADGKVYSLLGKTASATTSAAAARIEVEMAEARVSEAAQVEVAATSAAETAAKAGQVQSVAYQIAVDARACFGDGVGIGNTHSTGCTAVARSTCTAGAVCASEYGGERRPPGLQCGAACLPLWSDTGSLSDGNDGDDDAAGPTAAVACVGRDGFGRAGGGAGECGGNELVPPATAATAAAAVAEEASLLSVLRHPVSRGLLLGSCFLVFSLAMTSYGVTLALQTLPGSLHANFCFNALAELPAYLVIGASADTLGRRLVVGAGTGLAGAACVACALVPRGGLQVALAVVGCMGCSGAWALGLTFASELFPTALRSAALSAVHLFEDLGGILTPSLMLLGRSAGGSRLALAPFLVMGANSLAAMAIVWKLPETCRMPQLDTLEQLLEWMEQRRSRSGGRAPAP